MTTMIERVGRAVMHDALGDRRGYRQTWDGIDDDIREEIIEAVGRAAIEAMRPLIDAMDQLLDDMGDNGLCVCPAAKGQARKAAELIRSDAAYEGRALAPEGAAYMASLKAEGRKMGTPHVSVRTAGEELLLRFAYDAAAIALAKAANGKWDPDRRCWVYPIAAARALHPVVDKIETALNGPTDIGARP